MADYQPHYPSKWTVAGVFFAIFLMIGGVFLWAFVFNLGTVVVRSDQDFSLIVDGDTVDCGFQECRVDLAVGDHQFLAQAPGSRDQIFSLTVSRGELLDIPLTFQLIPTLQALSEPLPPSDAISLQLLESSVGYEIQDSEGDSLLTFESLVDPRFVFASHFSAVLDEGRFFVLDLVQMRRRRVFDDTVTVRDVRVSQTGERMLVFVRESGVDQVWMLTPSTMQLMPLSLPLLSDQLVFKPGSEHYLFVLSRDLQPTDETTFLDAIVEVTTDPTIRPLRLFLLNLDTLQIEFIADIGDEFESMFTRASRVFIQKSPDFIQEIVF